MASSSLIVARVMKQLGQVLDGLAAQPTADRTIRSRAEALLQQAGGMPVLLVANNSGPDIDVNDRAAQLTGYSRSELLRMSVSDLTPPRARWYSVQAPAR